MYKRKNGRTDFGLYIVLAVAVLAAVMLLSVIFRRKATQTGTVQDTVSELTQTGETGYDRNGTYRPTEESYDYTELGAAPAAEYENGGTLSCLFPSGSSFSIGTDCVCNDGLVLNPVYTCVEDELVMGQAYTQFCFFVTSPDAVIEYSGKKPDIATSKENNGETNLCVTGRTYDTLVPSAYRSADMYGVKWTAAAGSARNSEIAFRVVRLPDGHLMGIAKADVVFDNGYHLDNLRYENPVAAGYLTEEWKSRIVNDAVNFLVNGTEAQTFAFAGTSWVQPAEEAIVDKTARTYFGKLYDSKSEVTNSGKYAGMDIYAVNINQIGIGFVTVYFAPQNQLWGLTGTTNSKTGDIDLKLFGYDPVAPFTANTIAVPEYDRQSFGLAEAEEENL